MTQSAVASKMVQASEGAAIRGTNSCAVDGIAPQTVQTNTSAADDPQVDKSVCLTDTESEV